MRIDELQWDDENVEHIALHGVAPREVEDICFGLHIGEREDGDRYILSGQTVGGRYLNVVVERTWRGKFRPITAFDRSETYRSRYTRKLHKGRKT